ncbi:MAG: hypothetical protein ACMV0Y_06885, partial [Paludibacter sp.]
PRMMLSNINISIFPKLRKSPTSENIRRIVRYEWFTGLFTVAGITILGYPAIYLLGGQNMLDAYPIAILMSFTLLAWLIVGAYIYHIFIPNKLNYYITMNQAISLVSFVFFLIPGYILLPGIYAVIIPLVLSTFVEIYYSRTIVYKKGYL